MENSLKTFEHYYGILMAELNSWLEAAIMALPNLVIACLVIVVFALLSYFISSFFSRLVDNFSDSKVLINLTRTVIRVLILLLGFVIALGVMGLQKAVFSILAGAGVLGLALGFAFQDLASNFLAGVFMAFRNPFRIGDVIETNDYLGSVVNMNLRNTLVRNFDGQMVIIPNKQVFENPLINYSTYGKRRIHLVVGVAYDTDLSVAEKTLIEAIEKLGFIEEEEGVTAVASEFGDSSINFDVYFWIGFPDGKVGYLDAVNQGVGAIHRSFGEKGINIPFPIRTLDISMSKKDLSALTATKKTVAIKGGLEKDPELADDE